MGFTLGSIFTFMFTSRAFLGSVFGDSNDRPGIEGVRYAI